MTIHWSLLGPALLLLLYPADGLLSARVELRSFACFQSLENSPRHRPWWWVPALWLDPLRGLAGTLLLQPAFAIVSDNWMLAEHPAAYWWMIGILGLAVFSQVVTRRERGVLLAPIGFVAGIVVALVPWPVALIGFAMATAALFAFRQFHAFFSVGFLMVALLGFVFNAEIAWLAPAVGVLGLPLAACLVTGSTLELPTRNSAAPLRPPKLST